MIYAETFGPPYVSRDGRALWTAATADAIKRRSCYPGWLSLTYYMGWTLKRALAACDELEAAGVIARSFPSTIPALEVTWPLGGGIRLPAHEWKVLRTAVFARDDYTCRYCGDRGGRLECDHIQPISRGGSDSLTNLATACFSCNRSKRNKLLSEWKAA